MRRITIRNLGSTKVAKPRVFDAFIDGGRVFFEVKSGSRSVEIVALDDILDQIASAETEGEVHQTPDRHAVPDG